MRIAIKEAKSSINPESPSPSFNFEEFRIAVKKNDSAYIKKHASELPKLTIDQKRIAASHMIASGHYNLLLHLYESGIDFNSIPGQENATGHFELTKKLIKSGADPKVKTKGDDDLNENGETVVDYAIRTSGSNPTAQVLECLNFVVSLTGESSKLEALKSPKIEMPSTIKGGIFSEPKKESDSIVAIRTACVIKNYQKFKIAVAMHESLLDEVLKKCTSKTLRDCFLDLCKKYKEETQVELPSTIIAAINEKAGVPMSVAMR